jgi:hypothetical protein
MLSMNSGVADGGDVARPLDEVLLPVHRRRYADGDDKLEVDR